MTHRTLGASALLFLSLALIGSASAAQIPVAQASLPTVVAAPHTTAVTAGDATHLRDTSFAPTATTSVFVAEIDACTHVTPETFCSCYPEHCGHG